MTPETRQVALEKLAAFHPKIGYPERWRDYSGLSIVRGDAFGNLTRARVFEWQRQVRRLKEPTDRGEWGMTPQTINAYYNPTFNEVVFPAAILQPPFFDPGADPAVNYGGIGAVIGHEMGHGFDDQGSKSDARGVLHVWWQQADTEACRKRAGRPVDEALGPLAAALGARGAAVLEAPPGAGKSTVVPLALLGEDWAAGKRLIMLEPRRLAARACAERMAQSLGESVGRTVGYRM